MSNFVKLGKRFIPQGRIKYISEGDTWRCRPYIGTTFMKVSSEEQMIKLDIDFKEALEIFSSWPKTKAYISTGTDPNGNAIYTPFNIIFNKLHIKKIGNVNNLCKLYNDLGGKCKYIDCNDNYGFVIDWPKPHKCQG